MLDGILVIALADSMSDALGVHLSQEAVPGHTTRTVWAATLATFAAKLAITLSFLVPVLLLDGSASIATAMVWGLLVLAALSVHLARVKQVPVLPMLAEHLTIALLVVLAAHWIGEWAHGLFA